MQVPFCPFPVGWGWGRLEWSSAPLQGQHRVVSVGQSKWIAHAPERGGQRHVCAPVLARYKSPVYCSFTCPANKKKAVCAAEAYVAKKIPFISIPVSYEKQL